ncbi:hypothetical protein DEO72_LG2g1517 [Vigna unguiculata]|uniref:Uncharacterized protein n=1 Tax=Vigna unguiculata TaxID=3917 RepID=A0A4D6KUU6_VIGUN|nr:hypothetical protein DEO72_LG2g1517 [Vigna unguiculata]
MDKMMTKEDNLTYCFLKAFRITLQTISHHFNKLDLQIFVPSNTSSTSSPLSSTTS